MYRSSLTARERPTPSDGPQQRGVEVQGARRRLHSAKLQRVSGPGTPMDDDLDVVVPAAAVPRHRGPGIVHPGAQQHRDELSSGVRHARSQPQGADTQARAISTTSPWTRPSTSLVGSVRRCPRRRADEVPDRVAATWRIAVMLSFGSRAGSWTASAARPCSGDAVGTTTTSWPSQRAAARRPGQRGVARQQRDVLGSGPSWPVRGQPRRRRRPHRSR